MNGSTAIGYTAGFNKVFDYIDKHLDEELSVVRLSQIANLSEFHQFSEHVGISMPLIRTVDSYSKGGLSDSFSAAIPAFST